MSQQTPIKSTSYASRALELAMRDILDGLADLATWSAYRSVPGSFEILSIEPPNGRVQVGERCSTAVLRPPTQRSSDVVSYLMERESRTVRLSA